LEKGRGRAVSNIERGEYWSLCKKPRQARRSITKKMRERRDCAGAQFRRRRAVKEKKKAFAEEESA